MTLLTHIREAITSLLDATNAESPWNQVSWSA